MQPQENTPVPSAPIRLDDLFTVEEFAKAFPKIVPSVLSLRWQLRNRRQNGLAHACVRNGRRILISKARFEEWLSTQTDAMGVAA